VFDWYVGMLAFSGLLMIVMAVVKGGQRAWEALPGAVAGLFSVSDEDDDFRPRYVGEVSRHRVEGWRVALVPVHDEYLLGSGGAHRLAIAKLLRIPTIEVYVLTRHESWQESRDRAFAGELTRSEHPDLTEFTVR
jgi:hypothetical protein